MTDLVVAGAGMAGLAAAAEARRLGAEPLVLEKLPRPGGSMRLSSGVVWRHRELDRFREECPDGDERLQRLLFERLDGDVRWLESLGAPVVARETGNPLTAGTRFDPAGLTEALVEAAGGVQLGERLREPPPDVPLVLATGGFAADRELLREHVSPEAGHALLRAAPGGTGDGLRIGLAAGAATSAGLDQVYARAMPAPPARVGEGDLVWLSQLYARHAQVANERGERYEPRTWSEIDVAQWQLRQPRARAWFTVPNGRLDERVRDRTVGEMVDAAEAAGAPVRRGEEHVTVETVAGVTTTLGGLAIDEHARAAPGLFACGADAGGIATGGYASGLAAALVFGRIAARAALGEEP
ncbi:MAG TPA: FAD-dependent oxidoreductase [Thermoleophilaceae bacterium]|nr:FAD-dependent oxidoreductase [Thermoleophilaceae bacterium]